MKPRKRGNVFSKRGFLHDWVSGFVLHVPGPRVRSSWTDRVSEGERHGDVVHVAVRACVCVSVVGTGSGDTGVWDMLGGVRQ